MLAPSLLSVEEDLAATAAVLLNIGGFARACLLANVAQQDPPLGWVNGVQGILADCRQVAQSWLNASQNVVAPLSESFITYSSLMSAAVEDLTATNIRAEAWIELLTDLRAAAQANSDRTLAAQQVLTDHQRDFEGAHGELQTAVRRAQEGMEAKEADILAISVKVQELNDQLETYGVEVSSAAMDAGETVVQTLVELDYEALTAASEEVPLVSIVTILYTTGSLIKTVVADDAKISSLLNEVSTLLAQLDQDERALAMTHALVQRLSQMNEAYIGAAQLMPRIHNYWTAEADKIQVVLEALRADSKPVDITEIVSLPAAATVWQRLAKLAKGMVIPVIQETKPVALSVSAGAR